MDQAQRLVQARQSDGGAQLVRQVLLDQRDQRVQVLFNDGPQLPDSESLRRRIHGKYAARRASRILGAEVDPLPWLELPAVKKTTLPVDEQHVVFLDASIQEGLARPGRLDHS